MLQKINPPSIVEPFNNAYHHIVVVPPNARLAYISGQVGLRPDGSTPDSVEEQADQAWFNGMEALKEVGLDSSNIVKVTAYLIEENEYSAFAAARKKYTGDARPASTALLVKQLVSAEWRVEIDIVAAGE